MTAPHKTYGQIVQQFGYITQVASPPLNPHHPYGPAQPDQGVYFQELIMGDQLDENGNPVLDDNGNPVQVPVDYDDVATNDAYHAWLAENGLGRAAGEDDTGDQTA